MLDEEDWAAKPSPLTAGQMLGGKYKITRELGGGAMGVVYEAYHPLLQKTVAVKVLRPELARLEDLRDRFEAEARATAAIGHPNIIAVTDMGQTENGALYFVMDRLRGETLTDRLEARKKMDIQSAAIVALDVLAGLEAAHALKLVHRDLKPDNIFLSKPPAGREIAKILDFGIAKALASLGKRKTGTRVGFTVGTPMYMAPEQAMGAQDIDPRVDLWAMGVIFYEMLSGKPPFEADEPMAVLARIVSTKPEPLETLCPDVPPALARLIESALSTERKERPASAAEFSSRLQEIVFGHTTPIPVTGMAMSGPASPASIKKAETAVGFAVNNLSAFDQPVLVDLAGDDLKKAGPAASAPVSSLSDAPDVFSADPTEEPVLELAHARASRPITATPAFVPDEIPAPATRRRSVGSPLRLLAYLIPVGVLAAGFFVLKPMFFKVEEPATQTVAQHAPAGAKVPAQTVWVKFEVTPAIAQLYLDGIPLPQNPAPLVKGEVHTITGIAEGYEIEVMKFSAERARSVYLQLAKKKSR